MPPQRFSLEQAQEEFERHNLEEHVSSGGQKDVFQGEFEGQKIVLKTIIVENYEATRRAEREIEAMEIIESDILVDLIQSFPAQIDGHEVFVMVEEYLEGPTLHNKLVDDGPSLELAFEVTETLLTALIEFNEKEMVHRDIKPRNIILTPEEGPKVLDVGIVRMLNKEGLTPTFRDAAPGTPKYSAPEQLANESDKQDTRTDLFSTGIVFSQCLTGTHPFDRDGISVQEAIHAGERDPVAESLDHPFAKQIDYYLDIMLAPVMNGRFNTPREALSQLESIKERFE
jgi:serine/threonine-protein kinase